MIKGNTVSVNLSANESAENQPVNAHAREDEDRRDSGTFTLSGKQVPDAECIQVRNWRYKLQKVFLSGNASPEYEVRPGLLFFIVSGCFRFQLFRQTIFISILWIPLIQLY